MLKPSETRRTCVHRAGSQVHQLSPMMSYLFETTWKLSDSRTIPGELAFRRQKRNLPLVQQRLSAISSHRIGPGTIGAALVALSMAVIGHFFI